MPKAARERFAIPPAGTALARATRLCLPGHVREGRDSEPNVTKKETNVNVAVTRNFVILRWERSEPRRMNGLNAAVASFEGRSGIPSRKRDGCPSRPPQDDGQQQFRCRDENLRAFCTGDLAWRVPPSER